MAEHSRWTRGFRVGVAVLAALAALAVCAPLLATDLPWLARGDDGLSFPAFRAAMGRPTPVDDSLTGLVRAPIPYSPARGDLDAVLQPPSGAHWLGTDGLGRDLAARVVFGGRVSLAVGLIAAALAIVVGLPLGAIAGYHGGWVDAAVSRLIEGVLSFPALLLALALLAMSPGWLGAAGDVVKVSLVLGLTGWIPVARYLRGEFLRLRGSDMVVAARAAGAGDLRVFSRPILPSAMAPVLVTAAFAVGAAILLEAALSFLGLGVRPPTPTWGGLLTEARAHIDSAWWLGLYPGLCLFLAVLGCNLVGEGIRDRLDPRRRP